MYICDDCGKLHDKLPTAVDLVGYYGNEPQYEAYTVEECGCGGWLREAEKCPHCKDYKVKDNFIDDFCCECSDELYNKFKTILKEIFTNEEINWLYDNWEED